VWNYNYCMSKLEIQDRNLKGSIFLTILNILQIVWHYDYCMLAGLERHQRIYCRGCEQRLPWCWTEEAAPWISTAGFVGMSLRLYGFEYWTVLNLTVRHAVAQWLRHCATSRKVAGSIPDGVIGIFNWRYPSGRTRALVSTQPLTEMSTRKISWG
jgi:hypothetical protein